MGNRAATRPPGDRVRERVSQLDWENLERSLDERGFATTPRLLGAGECSALERLYDDDTRFRSTVDMARHRFGEGEYRYFADPIPEPVLSLRRALYPPLSRIANRWRDRLGRGESFPTRFDAFRAHCRSQGQLRPTPLLLRYDRGGFNCLHQDTYGSVAFPLQLTVLLSRPGVDFEGGEFLLVEQRPRQQSRGTAIVLERGQAVLFPNQERPVRGVRGVYGAQHRHGVSEVKRGRRHTLGVIFHDAR